jgi:recombinational DNA repair protein (RecF pathway)
MQGYILNINKAKEEDLLVTILSRENLDTLYRFYGARHGVINLGFKIDYEKESSPKSTIFRLKDVIHIGFKWINDYKLLKNWQDFTALFYKHLKDAETLDPFYFELLENASINWNKQNSKRVAIEHYVKLLEHEGRLHKKLECFLCTSAIMEEEVSLLRAFLPAHRRCSHTFGISKNAFDELFSSGSTLFLDDNEVEKLWHILLQGL